MNIYHNIDDIIINDISYYKPIQNKIIHYKYFYKIIYNVGLFTLNTLIINIDVKNMNIQKEHNLYKVSFVIDPLFLEKLKEFEIQLLDHFNHITNKKVSLSFHKYVNKLIYTSNTPNIHISLRISGIWESDTQIGITSKLSVN